MARKSRKDVVVPEKPKKPTMKVWRAALYIRLSVEFNGKRGDSLETQRQIMETYITLCPDIEIVGIYTDNGITGRTFEREAFQRMLHDVEDGKVDCIVVKDLSRLGRNTIDTGYYIEKYFPLHEPIISRELFAAVQVIRQKAAEKYTQNEKKPYTENILRGRVFCGCCGKNLHRQRSTKYFYRCISNDRRGKGACLADIRYIPEDDLFDTILTIIRQKAEIVMGEALRLRQCDGRIAAKKTAVDGEISELQQQTIRNRDLLAGLYGSFVKGVLTRAEYLEMKEDYSLKISGAVDRVQRLQAEQSELERQMARYTSMADKLAMVDKDATLTALLVNQLIERVTVNGPNDVTIKFTFESGFESIKEVLAHE